MSSHTNNMTEPANQLAHRNGWHWARLGDHVAKIGSGLTPLGGHASYQASGIPLIRSQNVHMNRFEPDGLAFISAEQDEAMSVSRVQPGDVLLNITGASIGRVCVVPSERCPANVNQHVCVIRGDGSLDSEFVAFFLASPEFQSFIWETQAGATRQALTKALIEDFRIPFTSLEEQQRIAGRLREQLAEVAKARTAVQAQLAAAQALSAALFRAVFDSPDAESWSRMPLKKLIVSKLRTGISKSTDNDSPNRCLTLSSVRNGELKTDESKPAAITDAELLKFGIKPGVFYVVRGNGSRSLVARAGQAPKNFAPVAFPDLLIEVMPDPALLVSDYFRFAWDAPEVRRDIEDRVRTAAGIYKINLQNLSEVGVPVPGLDDQRAIAARLAAELAEVTRLRESLSGKLETLDRLPAALLAQAFQGGQ